MQANFVEPLEFTIWVDRIRRLSNWPADSSSSLEKALRHAFHLVQLAPLQLRPFVSCGLSEAQFEAELEAGAHLSAALALICDGPSHNFEAAQMDAEGDAPAGRVFGEWLSRVITLSVGALAHELVSSSREMSKAQLHILHYSSRANGG